MKKSFLNLAVLMLLPVMTIQASGQKKNKEKIIGSNKEKAGTLPGGGSDIVTVNTCRNFDLIVDFKYTPGAKMPGELLSQRASSRILRASARFGTAGYFCRTTGTWYILRI